MLSLALPVSIFLCVEPTDMRSGYDRLAQRAQDHAGRVVLDGGLFVFFNRRRNRVKLLYWDRDGLAVWQKRLEFVPASLYVIEHVRWKYACRACQEHVAVAPRPAKPLEKGLPGAGLLAAVAVGKYCEHLPLYRLEDIFARQGQESETVKRLRPLLNNVGANGKRYGQCAKFRERLGNGVC